MSFSFSSLIRMIVLLVVGSTVLAVGVARFDPPRPRWRSLEPVHHYNVSEYFLDVADRTPHWLDTETGVITTSATEDGDVVEVASVSPWTDEKGRRQMAGRWSSRIKDGPMSMCKDFGLARYSFPDGRLLDHVSTETVPVGPPCWYPGTEARVLFAAGDGNLYRYDFDAHDTSKRAQGGSTQRSTTPWQVNWHCPMPGVGEVFISDVGWPDDPRMDGRLVATLRIQEFDDLGRRGYSRTQLWTLKLNHAGTEIVEASRLLLPSAGQSGRVTHDERSPTVASRPDGRLVLAYLRQDAREARWQLRLAPVHLETDRHIPTVSGDESVLLSDRCQPSHPSFSLDGRWINAIVGNNAMEGKIHRFRSEASQATVARAAPRP